MMMTRPDARRAWDISQGSVSFEPAGTEDWVSAVVNRPITTGDKLWTDRGARAELNIGSAAIRLAKSNRILIFELIRQHGADPAQ